MNPRRPSFPWSISRGQKPRILSALGLLVAITWSSVARADDAEPEPTKWEQLFFPFPIVGAPPQLEQQAQIFNAYYRGNKGSADVPSAELGLILSPHLGIVVTVPFQIGIEQETTGFGDGQLLLQYLALGSLAHDNMLSIGMMGTFPTGRDDLSAGDYFVGPFAYAAQRFFHRLVFEGNVTALLPIVHGASSRQLLGTAYASVLLTPIHSSFPVYASVELNSTTYLDGSTALPPGATKTPAETLFIAPEVFLGPFKSPIDDGTRIAAGVSFNVTGDPVHAQSVHDHGSSFDISRTSTATESIEPTRLRELVRLFGEARANGVRRSSRAHRNRLHPGSPRSQLLDAVACERVRDETTLPIICPARGSTLSPARPVLMSGRLAIDLFTDGTGSGTCSEVKNCTSNVHRRV